MTYSCIIIDDMELARTSIKSILTNIPELDVVGEADSVVSGAKLLRQKKPDIVFLDIHLGDGEGFDILEIVPDSGAQVIFTTASDEHAIKAFRYAAIDYILKPVDQPTIQAAVDRVVKMPLPQQEQIGLLKSSMKTQQATSKIALHTSDLIKIADISDIVRLEANGNYTQFFFRDDKKLLVTKTLKEFDKILVHNGFLRTHQSHLINSSYIKAYVKSEGGYIEMKDGSIIPVSVRKKAAVIEALSEL